MKSKKFSQLTKALATIITLVGLNAFAVPTDQLVGDWQVVQRKCGVRATNHTVGEWYYFENAAWLRIFAPMDNSSSGQMKYIPLNDTRFGDVFYHNSDVDGSVRIDGAGQFSVSIVNSQLNLVGGSCPDGSVFSLKAVKRAIPQF